LIVEIEGGSIHGSFHHRDVYGRWTASQQLGEATKI